MDPNQPNPNPAVVDDQTREDEEQPIGRFKSFIFKKRSKIADLFSGFFFHLISYVILIFLFKVAFAFVFSSSGNGMGYILFGVIIIVALSVIFTFILDIIIAALRKSVFFFVGAFIAFSLPWILNLVYFGNLIGPCDAGLLILEWIL